VTISQASLGKQHFRVAVIRDISERKQFEAELHSAKEQAETTSRAKSDFLANMSHEIRTPLSAILGTLSLLLETSLTKKQRSFAETAHESGKALLTIVNDILDFSRIEAGRLRLEAVNFDVVQTVESIAELLSIRAYNKRIEIVTFIHPDVPRWLRADEGRLRQILLNLAGNAIKFTRSGGVAIEVSFVKGEAERLWLRFEVTDTGIGIPQTMQDKLFERFCYSQSRKEEGAGLGLAISRRLVEMMGGEIGFSSSEGQGSIFWFTLVCTPASLTLPLSTLPSLAGLRVLLVEENPVSLRIHERQLRAWHMEVTGVDSGSAALRLLHESCWQDSPFDVVLIDQWLPDVSGEELGITLSHLPALANTHPILMTVMDASTISARIRKVGFYASLTKPVRQASLYRWVGVSAGLLKDSSLESEVTKKTSAEATRRPQRRGRLLLVEDDQVNQAVAVTMLEKVGYQVDTVNNGVKAIKAVRTAAYDMVLMDLAMPEMDGIEATEQIRRLPGQAGQIPVIAMTASALPENRDRCIAAGMNDYLTKPIDRTQMLAVIDRWLSAAQGELVAGDGEHLDLQVLQQLAADTNPDMLSQLIGLFIEQTHGRLDQMAKACASRDWEYLQREAHALKSSSGTFGAERLQDHSRRLEEACQQGNSTVALALTDSLKDIASPVLVVLAHYRERQLQVMPPVQ
jgi:CheY-like chemotaxis protein/HPt (histidine-containing phosphotransfer) domain-containing protein